MSAAIPTKARKVVAHRQGGRCAMCGMAATEIHHRLRRRDGGHAYSNLVHLCGTDHKWVHAHPREAMALGFIVSAHSTDPALVPIKTFEGWALYDNDGWTTFPSSLQDN